MQGRWLWVNSQLCVMLCGEGTMIVDTRQTLIMIGAGRVRTPFCPSLMYVLPKSLCWEVHDDQLILFFGGCMTTSLQVEGLLLLCSGLPGSVCVCVGGNSKVSRGVCLCFAVWASHAFQYGALALLELSAPRPQGGCLIGLGSGLSVCGTTCSHLTSSLCVLDAGLTATGHTLLHLQPVVALVPYSV